MDVIQSLFLARGPKALQQDAPTPLYHQMYLLLKNSICDGTLGLGTQLPTEQQLAEAFDVSRITAKRAMDDLASEGLVERRRGKGTHVIFQYTQPQQPQMLEDGMEELQSVAEKTDVTVLDAGHCIPPAEVRDILGLTEGEAAYRILRIRSINGQPFGFYSSWTLNIGDHFDSQALSHSRRVEVLAKYGLDLHDLEQTITATEADDSTAAQLKLASGHPLMKMVRYTRDKQGNVIDYLEGLYNPKLFQWRMKLDINKYRN